MHHARVQQLLAHLPNSSCSPNFTNASFFQSTENRVKIDIKDEIAVVSLNRPNKKNALDGPMFKALNEAGEFLRAASGVRVVVLTGEGSSFCSGIDLASLGMLSKGTGMSTLMQPYDKRGITHIAQQVTFIWQELPMPVIAAVQGHAIGGGCQLALGADIRFVHPDTQLSIRETFWGIIPDMGATMYLRNLGVRDDVAKELIWTARIFSGTEAHALGLATRLSSDPLAEAMSLAAELCGRSPDAIRAVKRLLNRPQHAVVAAQFQEERHEIGSLIGTPNQVEAVASGMQKRVPKFRDAKI